MRIHKSFNYNRNINFNLLSERQKKAITFYKDEYINGILKQNPQAASDQSYASLCVGIALAMGCSWEAMYDVVDYCGQMKWFSK